MKEKANHFLRVLINVWKKKWSDLFTWSYVWWWKRQMATPVTFVLIKMYSPLIFLVIITNMKKDQSAQQWYLMTWVMVSNFSKENSRSTIQFPSIGVGQGKFMISPNISVRRTETPCPGKQNRGKGKGAEKKKKREKKMWERKWKMFFFFFFCYKRAF